MSKSIAQHLADLGAPAGCRSWTLQCIRGAHHLKPRGGVPIGLHTVLPPGATVTLGGISVGIEYSPTGSGYVRINPFADFGSPQELLVDMIDSDADVTI